VLVHTDPSNTAPRPPAVNTWPEGRTDMSLTVGVMESGNTDQFAPS
jgi:hypothetical protein